MKMINRRSRRGQRVSCYLMHMRKTLYPFTGRFPSCLKTLANRSKPRPLLVVHSGNTTTGPCTRFLTCSKLSYFSLSSEIWVGILPVYVIMDQSETTLKPSTFTRGVGRRFFEANVAEFEIAAEPVPVLRPGVWTVGAEEVSGSSWTGSVIGKTNVGSNLCGSSSN